MDELHGHLSVCGLENVESRKEAAEARLHGKLHLHSLGLEWASRDHAAADPGVDEEVIEGLKPHANLRELKIEGYGGTESPSWISEGAHLSRLEALLLSNCDRWEVLPPLGLLPSLKSLKIEGMKGAKSAKGVKKVAAFGRRDLPGGRGGRAGMVPEWEQWFPVLSVLKISNCPALREFPSLPLTLTELEFSDLGLNALPMLCGSDDNPAQSGGGGGTTAITSSASTRRNSSLRSVTISRCRNLASLREGLMMAGSHLLTALRTLTLNHCEELRLVPDGGFSNLAALESLTIDKCPKLIVPHQDNLPPSLTHLKIISCHAPVNVSLLTGLRNVTSLQTLKVRRDDPPLCLVAEYTSGESLRLDGCAGLHSGALAACLQGLASISRLEISNCPDVTSLPGEALRLLTALRELEISDCARLTSIAIPAGLVLLESLRIESCPRLTSLISDDDVPGMHGLVSTTRGDGGCLRSMACLRISGCPRMSCFGQQLLRRMTVLKELEIADCGEPTSMPLQELVSLEDLTISDCPNLHHITAPSPPPGSHGSSLPLKTLSVDNARVLISLLSLTNPTTLTNLVVRNCLELKSFTAQEEEVLTTLISLCLLSFGNCPDLQSLPAELHALPSPSKNCMCGTAITSNLCQRRACPPRCTH